MKLNHNEVLKILRMYYNLSMSVKEIAHETGINPINIHAIVKRRSWKHVNFNIPDSFIKPNNRIGFRQKFRNKNVLDDNTISDIRLKYYKFGFPMDLLCREYNLLRYQILQVLNILNIHHNFNNEIDSVKVNYEYDPY